MEHAEVTKANLWNATNPHIHSILEGFHACGIMLSQKHCLETLHVHKLIWHYELNCPCS